MLHIKHHTYLHRSACTDGSCCSFLPRSTAPPAGWTPPASTTPVLMLAYLQHQRHSDGTVVGTADIAVAAVALVAASIVGTRRIRPSIACFRLADNLRDFGQRTTPVFRFLSFYNTKKLYGLFLCSTRGVENGQEFTDRSPCSCAVCLALSSCQGPSVLTVDVDERVCAGDLRELLRETKVDRRLKPAVGV